MQATRPGLLGHHLQPHPLLRLQADQQAVGLQLAGIGGKDGEGRAAELDDDLRDLLRQALAGAEVEGDIGPAPGVHMGLHGDEGLGGAGAVAEIGEIAGDGLAVHRARRVLAAHDRAGEIRRHQRAQRTQHLQLLVAHRIGVERNGAFHGKQAEKLQDMVLQHVAHGAGPVVIAAAPLHADSLADGDLDMVDHVRVPEPFEDGVGEAQREQVLHRLLAEIVVDAEKLRLRHHGTDRVVDRPGRGEIAADRLLQHHARLRRQAAMGLDIAADRAIEIGRGGEVVGAHDIGAFVQPPYQLRPATLAGAVHAVVDDEAQEILHRGGVEIRLHELPQALLGTGAVAIVGEVGARGGDDAAGVVELPVTEAVVERGQQLAHRQVAGGAEDDVIELRDGNDLGHHGLSGLFPGGDGQKTLAPLSAEPTLARKAVNNSRPTPL